MIIFFVIFLLLGALAGGIASFMFRNKEYGFDPVGNMILGTIGAELGGFMSHSLTKHAPSFLGELATAVFGAVCLLYVARFVRK